MQQAVDSIDTQYDNLHLHTRRFLYACKATLNPLDAMVKTLGIVQKLKPQKVACSPGSQFAR